MLEYGKLLTMVTWIGQRLCHRWKHHWIALTFGSQSGLSPSERTLSVRSGYWRVARFRILKTGIRLLRQKSADVIFLTCCALHNWLLNESGLSEGLEDGTPSIWEGSIGFHYLSDAQECVPEHVGRLLLPHELRTFDLSRVGLPGSVNNTVDVHSRHQSQHVNDDRHEQEEREGLPVTTWNKVVRNLNLSNFRSKLIKHFDMAFQRNEIEWPGKGNRVMELAF
jgi:hypothetical protein